MDEFNDLLVLAGCDQPILVNITDFSNRQFGVFASKILEEIPLITLTGMYQ